MTKGESRISEQEKQDTTQDNVNALSDLEPQDEVVGGTKELTGTLVLASTNESLQKKHIANIKWTP